MRDTVPKDEHTFGLVLRGPYSGKLSHKHHKDLGRIAMIARISLVCPVICWRIVQCHKVADTPCGATFFSMLGLRVISLLKPERGKVYTSR